MYPMCKYNVNSKSFRLTASLKRIVAVIGLIFCFSAHVSYAGSREQAKRIHDRLVGTHAQESTLVSMASDISANDAIGAAETAMEQDGFYNVTLKNMIMPWTNEEQTVFAPLNDYVALVIGVIRDDLDFRRILYDDLLYVGDSNLGLTDYSATDNNHYEELENQNRSLKDNLVRFSQVTHLGIPEQATAGVMTTRAAAKSFFKDGTNRAMFRFTLMNHLCTDLEGIKDITRPPDRIRQDVTRSPGGDSSIFLNNCIGCHSGMDPMAQAYAYYEYEYDVDTDPDALNGRLVYNLTDDIDEFTGIRVQKKYHINANNFKYGFITPDDRWDNYWREGDNALLGWDETLSGGGNGAKSMGQELAHSEAFAQCQVKKVFKTVCLREPVTEDDSNQIDTMVTSFKGSGYKLKQVFAESAVYCMGD